MSNLANVIYFENGIEHQLTIEEINVIRKALVNFKIDNDEEQKALQNLQSLFIHHLD
ncbi:TPA: hypothetical protein ACK03F_002647 [Staphylococcus aureus]